jgi:hypothetical protein
MKSQKIMGTRSFSSCTHFNGLLVALTASFKLVIMVTVVANRHFDFSVLKALGRRKSVRLMAIHTIGKILRFCRIVGNWAMRINHLPTRFILHVFFQEHI